MSEERILSIIQLFENMKHRLPMYVNDQAPHILTFLHGFNLACLLWGATNEDIRLSDEILLRHGWHPSSVAPIQEMQARGLSQEEMAQELLSLYIEQWQQKLAKQA